MKRVRPANPCKYCRILLWVRQGSPLGFAICIFWVRLGSPFVITFLAIYVIRMSYWVRLGAPGAPFGCAGFAIWVRQVRLLRFWVRRRTFWVRPSKKAHLLGSHSQKAHLGFAFSKGAPWARQIHVNGFSDSSNAASWILRYPVLNMHGRITLSDGTRTK